MNRSVLRAAGAAGILALGLAMTACSAGGGASAASNQKKESLSFWGWAPGYGTAVAEFDKTHPDIKVTYQEIQPGSKGGYQKMLDAVQAGDAPCLAQVGYETLPTFESQGALDNVAKYADADEKQFASWTWKAVSQGDAVYGAPVDTGPMAMFYNKKVFASLGIAVPTTWAQYEAAAEKIHASNPDMYISSPYMDYDYAGFDWQAGASWFSTSGGKWHVTMDSAAGTKVADFWQGLAADKLLSPAPMYDQSWSTGLGDGDIATVVGAVWQAAGIEAQASSAGDWAVAPMPQWSAGQDAVGNVGGSSTAVLKGCKAPQAAWTFADWMSTNRTAYTGLIKSASLYPAATSLLNLPILQKGVSYFGGQKIFDVFAKASSHVKDNWTWGPTMTQTATDLDDQLSAAWAGNGTVAGAFQTTQQKTIASMKSQGLSVAN